RRVLKSFGALSLKAGRVIGANAPAPGAAQNTADARTRLGPQGPQEGSADSNLPRAGRSGDGQGTGSSRITNSRLRHAQPSAREQEEIYDAINFDRHISHRVAGAGACETQVRASKPNANSLRVNRRGSG